MQGGRKFLEASALFQNFVNLFVFANMLSVLMQMGHLILMTVASLSPDTLCFQCRLNPIAETQDTEGRGRQGIEGYSFFFHFN